MIFETPLQDFTASSGIINGAFMENIYHSIIDNTFIELGRDIILHLEPMVEQDLSTQIQPQQSQFNPFFGRVQSPRTNTRSAGVRYTPRDVVYKAHIAIGPLDKKDDLLGIGNLKDNEIQLTLPIEALNHVKEALSVSVEGRRYDIRETRPIGFSTRRYIIVIGEEINEVDSSVQDTHG